MKEKKRLNNPHCGSVNWTCNSFIGFNTFIVSSQIMFFYLFLPVLLLFQMFSSSFSTCFSFFFLDFDRIIIFQDFCRIFVVCQNTLIYHRRNSDSINTLNLNLDPAKSKYIPKSKPRCKPSP